ncbi:MAG: hybrid sensor histidine kinase/response regulator [Proteobacteria bacterium]|nr:hybrid sensor histidine kinase/response regulator [Pseudomonadota bacterium]
MMRVVIPYATISALWILLSDAVVSFLFPDPTQIAIVSTLKGWFFVAVTSVLLLILIRRYRFRLKQRDNALRENEARYRKIFETALLGIATTDSSGRITSFNEAFRVMVGYDAESLCRMNYADLTHPDDIGCERGFFNEILARQRDQYRVEKRYLDHDGRILWVDLSVTAIRDSRGDVDSFVGMVHDITKRKQAETELIAAKTSAESANIAKSRFLAAASHDLRQPMQAISLFSNALAETELSAEQERISKYLTQSIQLLRDLLNALLDLSRFDADVARASHEFILAEELARRIDANFSSMAAEKSLRFKLWFPFKAMAIQTDGKLLMRLLGNLVENAIKYTSKGGILVSISRRGDQALIRVWDTGIGIAPEHLDDIFEEYFQIGNSERDNDKGLGLGLSIVSRIARLLTDIKCRSRPGKGSVFELSLPLAEHLPTETAVDNGHRATTA